MKTLSRILFLSAFTFAALSAKIWRVDSNNANAADFRTLQLAHDGANAGDTLYVAGSPVGYGAVTLTKPLVIIGPGYFLGENPQTQAYPVVASCGTMTFNNGSAGSIVTGMTTQNLYPYDNNITIKRNYIDGSIYPAGNKNVANIIVAQNYIVTSVSYASGSYSTLNMIVSNNIIMGGIGMYAGMSAIIQHNIISANSTIYNSTFENNILRGGVPLSYSSSTIQNNMCNAAQLDSANGNVRYTDMSTVFLNVGSTDGKWKLKNGSPAIGIGTNGADLGPYGGASPYVLSGMPSIPAIYSVTAPALVPRTQGLQVRVKAKSHN